MHVQLYLRYEEKNLKHRPDTIRLVPSYRIAKWEFESGLFRLMSSLFVYVCGNIPAGKKICILLKEGQAS